MELDLDDPKVALPSLLRARASLDGLDTVTWFTGEVYGWTDGAHQHLFGLEGYNVSRVVEADGGYDLLSREAVFYLDPTSRALLRTWTNPYTEHEVPVVHIWNDPVNQPLRFDGPRGTFRLPHSVVGDSVLFQMDVLLAYPSPLPRAAFADHSQSDTYHAAELFQFTCRASDLADESQPSVPAECAWTRIAPWLPFMSMGDAPGQLVYHCRGAKLPGGYPELPEWIRDEVATAQPQFATAPDAIGGPNETSWTYFRKLVESGQLPATPPSPS